MVKTKEAKAKVIWEDVLSVNMEYGLPTWVCFSDSSQMDLYVIWTSFSSSESHCRLDIYMEGNSHCFQVQAVEQLVVHGNKVGRVVWFVKKNIFSCIQPALVRTHFWVKLLFYTGTVLLPVSLMKDSLGSNVRGLHTLLYKDIIIIVNVCCMCTQTDLLDSTPNSCHFLH